MSKLSFDGDNGYIGNIWGWKWSLRGLAVILFVMALMLGRYLYLKSNGLYQADDQKPVKTEQVD